MVAGKVLRAFRDVEIEKLTPQSPIIFAGILPGRPIAGSWYIHLPQIQYAKELQKVDLGQFAQQGEILNAQKLWAAIRHVSGSLIWLRRTRPDIGFDITKIAPDSGSACADADLVLDTLTLYNRTVRFAKDYDAEIL